MALNADAPIFVPSDVAQGNSTITLVISPGASSCTGSGKPKQPGVKRNDRKYQKSIKRGSQATDVNNLMVEPDGSPSDMNQLDKKPQKEMPEMNSSKTGKMSRSKEISQSVKKYTDNSNGKQGYKQPPKSKMSKVPVSPTIKHDLIEGNPQSIGERWHKQWKLKQDRSIRESVHNDFPALSPCLASVENGSEHSMKPSPYLLALKKVNSETLNVQPSTHDEVPESRVESLINNNERPCGNSKNRIVTKLAKSTMDKLGPKWAEKLIEIKRKEQSMELQKNSVMSSEGDIQHPSLQQHASAIWNNILKPITPPVANSVYFSLSENETSSGQAKQNPSSTSCLNNKDGNIFVRQNWNAKGWWSAVFNNDCDVILDYIQHGFEWDIRYQSESCEVPKSPSAVDCINPNDCIGLNILHIYSKYKQYSATFFKLLNGNSAVLKNIEVKDRAYKRTILHFAAESGILEIVQEASKLGIDANYRDKCGDIALHLACKNGHLQVVQWLLGKSKHSRSGNGSGACGGGDGSGGLKVNLRNKKGQTPLHLSSNRNITVLLLEYGADPTIIDSEGYCSVSWAAIRGDASTLKALLACNSFKSLDQKRKHDHLDLGFNLDIDDNQKAKSFSNSSVLISASPLHHVAKNGNFPCLRLLLDYGYYDINAVDSPNGFTPLMYTCVYGHVESFLHLLNHGASTGCCVNTVANESHHELIKAILSESYVTANAYKLGAMNNSNVVGTMIDLQGMSEICLAGLFRRDRFIRQVSDYMRRCQLKNKFFSEFYCNGNKQNPLTCLSNSLSNLWLKPTCHPIDSALPIKLWRDEKKGEVFEIYSSTFIAMISSGVRLSKRFIDIFGSISCKQDLARSGIYHDWPLSISESLFMAEEPLEETPISLSSLLVSRSWLWNIFPKHMNEVRHEVTIQYCSNGTRNGDLAFMVQNETATMFSFSYFWRKRSATINEMLSIGMMKQMSTINIPVKSATKGRISDNDRLVYVMNLPHISKGTMSLLIEYVEKACDDLIFVITNVDQLIQLLFAANELLMEELQATIEQQLFRLKLQGILSNETTDELMSTLTLPLLKKLLDLEEGWKLHQRYSSTSLSLHQSATIDMISLEKINILNNTLKIHPNNNEDCCTGCKIETFSSWIEFSEVVDRYHRRFRTTTSSLTRNCMTKLTVRCYVENVHHISGKDDEGKGKQPIKRENFKFDIIEHHDIAFCIQCCQQLNTLLPSESMKTTFNSIPLYGNDIRNSLCSKIACSTNMLPFVHREYASSILVKNYSQSVVDCLDDSVTLLDLSGDISKTIPSNRKCKTNHHVDGITIEFPDIFQIPKISKTNSNGTSVTDDSMTEEAMKELTERCDKLRNYFLMLLQLRLPLLYQDTHTHDIVLHQEDIEENMDIVPYSIESQSSKSHYSCHKTVLTNSSDKFVAMMKFHDFQAPIVAELNTANTVTRSIVAVNMIDHKVLCPLLAFIYTGVIPLTTFTDESSGEVDHEVLLHLTRISDEYFMPALTKQACELLSLSITTRNVGEIFRYAFEHKIKTIGRVAACCLLMLLSYSSEPVSSILSFESDEDISPDGLATKEVSSGLCNVFLQEVFNTLVQ